MSDKGILSVEQEKILGAKLDELIDFKKIKGFGLLEVLDGFVFTQCIAFVDDKFGDMLPEAYKDNVGKLVISLVAEDWVGCEEPLIEILDALVDVPFVEDEEEAVIIKAIVEALFGILLNTVLKKNDVV